MMKNIEMAIAAEKKYIELKAVNLLEGKTIYDFLKPYGYDNLEKFRDDKVFHMFKQTCPEVIEITSEEIENSARDIFIRHYQQQKPYILYNISLNQNTAFVPLSNNRAYDGFLTIKPGYDCPPERGNILTFNSDLDVVMFIPDEVSEIYKKITKEIADYLKNYTDKEVVIDNNDILVGGKKVYGFANASDHGYSIGMFHISFTDNDDLIKSLCPESSKMPGHIDFMTAEQLFNHIVSWLL